MGLPRVHAITVHPLILGTHAGDHGRMKSREP